LREWTVAACIPVICASIYNAESFQPFFFTQPESRKSSRFCPTEITSIFVLVFVFTVSLSLLLGKPLLCNKFSTYLIQGFEVYLQKLQPQSQRELCRTGPLITIICGRGFTEVNDSL
jgi:hypothetical protein